MTTLTYAGIEYRSYEGKWVDADGAVASLETSRELDAAERTKTVHLEEAIRAAEKSDAPMVPRFSKMLDREAVAHANLNAAAPDLLAALKAMMALYDNPSRGRDAHVAARAAIEKAER